MSLTSRNIQLSTLHKLVEGQEWRYVWIVTIKHKRPNKLSSSVVSVKNEKTPLTNSWTIQNKGLINLIIVTSLMDIMDHCTAKFRIVQP